MITVKYTTTEDPGIDILMTDYPPVTEQDEEWGVNVRTITIDMNAVGLSFSKDNLIPFHIIKYGHVISFQNTTDFKGWLLENKNDLVEIMLIGELVGELDRLFDKFRNLTYVNMNQVTLVNTKSIEKIFNSSQLTTVKCEQLDVSGVENFNYAFIRERTGRDSYYQVEYINQLAKLTLEEILSTPNPDTNILSILSSMVMLYLSDVISTNHTMALEQLSGNDLYNYLIAYEELQRPISEEEQDEIDEILSNFDPEDITTWGYYFDYLDILIQRFLVLSIYWEKIIIDYNSSLSSEIYRNWDFSSATSMEGFFSYCTDTIIDIHDKDFPNLVDASSMFENTPTLESLLLKEENFINVTNASYMFNNCNMGANFLNLIDYSKATDISYMFGYLSLSNIDISDWELNPNGINMEGLFAESSTLQTVILDNLVFPANTNIKYLFKNCSSLSNVSIINTDFINITSLEGFFYGTTSLRKVTLYDPENMPNDDVILWNISNVTNLDYTFYNCGLRNNDVNPLYYRAFPTHNVTSMRYTFAENGSNCINTISHCSDWDTSNVVDMEGLFSTSSSSYSNSLSANLKRLDTSKVTNMSYMFADKRIESGSSYKTYMSNIVLPGDTKTIEYWSDYTNGKWFDLNTPTGDLNQTISKNGSIYTCTKGNTGYTSRFWFSIFLPIEQNINIYYQRASSGATAYVRRLEEFGSSVSSYTIYTTQNSAILSLKPGLNRVAIQSSKDDVAGSQFTIQLEDITIGNRTYRWHAHDIGDNYGYTYYNNLEASGKFDCSKVINMSHMFEGTCEQDYVTTDQKFFTRLNRTPNNFNSNIATDISYIFGGSTLQMEVELEFTSAQNASYAFYNNNQTGIYAGRSTYYDLFTQDTENPKKYNGIIQSNTSLNQNFIIKIPFNKDIKVDLPYKYIAKGNKYEYSIDCNNTSLSSKYPDAITGRYPPTEGNFTVQLYPGYNLLNIQIYLSNPQSYIGQNLGHIQLDDIIIDGETYSWEPIYTGKNYVDYDYSHINLGSSLRDINHIFAIPTGYSCYGTELYLPTMGTTFITDMSYAFFGQYELKGIYGLENWTVNNVETMEYMFCADQYIAYLQRDGTYSSYQNARHNGSIEALDLSNWRTASLDTIAAMFAWQSSLYELNLSNFVTTGISNITLAFYKVPAHITWKSTQTFDFLTDASYLYFDKDLDWFDINLLRNTRITNAEGMFSHCHMTATSTSEMGLDALDFSYCTNTSYMFEGCDTLREISFSGKFLQSVSNMVYMFKDCSNLRTIDLGIIDTTVIDSLEGLLSGCRSIEELIIDGDLTKMSKKSKKALYSNSNNIVYENTKDILEIENSTTVDQLFMGADIISETAMELVPIYEAIEDKESEEAKQLLEQIIHSEWILSLPKALYASQLFSGAKFYGQVKLETPKIEKYIQTFENVKVYEDKLLDLTNFDTTVATEFKNFLVGASADVIDISNLDLSKIEDFFSNRSPVYGSQPKLLKCNYWIINHNFNVLSKMFAECLAEEIQFNNLQTKDLETGEILDPYITNLSQMFFKCEKLKSVSMEGLNTSIVTDFSAMFQECSSLFSPDLSFLNTISAVTINKMFYKACNGGTLDLSGIKFNNMEDIGDVVLSCNADKIIFDDWDLTGFEDQEIFNGLKAYEIQMNNFNWGDREALIAPFKDCLYLESIDGSWYSSSVKYVSDIFYKCPNMYEFNINMLSTFENLEIIGSLCDGRNLDNYNRTQLTKIIYEGDFPNLKIIDRPSTVLYEQSNYTYNLKDGTQTRREFDAYCEVEARELNAPNLIDISRIFQNFIPTAEIFDMSKWYCPNLNSIPVRTYEFTLYKWGKIKEIIYPSFTPKTFKQIHYVYLSSATRVQIDYDFITAYKVFDSACTDSNINKIFAIAPKDDIDGTIPLLPNYLLDENGDGRLYTVVILEDGEDLTPKASNLAGSYTEILDISNANMINVKDFTYAFAGTNLKQLIASEDTFISAEDMSYSFQNCSNLTSTDFGCKYFPKVKKMEYMFKNCYRISCADLSDWNCPELTSMLGMFNWCYSSYYNMGLTSVNLTNFYAPKLIDVSYMFQYDILLDNIDFLSYFSNSNIETMEGLFYNCGCNGNVILKNLHLPKLTNTTSMFAVNSNVTGITLQNCSFESMRQLNFFNYSGIVLQNVAIKDVYTPNLTSFASMFSEQSKIRTVVFNNFTTGTITSVNSMFYNCSELEEVPDLSFVDTSHVYDWQHIFYNCKKIVTADFSDFDFSSAQFLSNMCCGCESLTSVTFGNNNLDTVTSFYNGFYGCKNLETVTFGSMKNIQDISGLFSGCSSLETVDCSGLNVATINSAYCAFQDCQSLVSVNFKDAYKYDHTNRKIILNYTNYYSGMNFNNMFKNCINLKNIKVGYDKTYTLEQTNVPQVIRMESMFENCLKLETDISKDNGTLFLIGPNKTYSVYAQNMYKNCQSITSLGLEENILNTADIVFNTLDNMFENCYFLTNVQTDRWSTTSKSITGLFKECRALTGPLNMKKLLTNAIEKQAFAFYDCRNLTEIISKRTKVVNGEAGKTIKWTSRSLRPGMGDTIDGVSITFTFTLEKKEYVYLYYGYSLSTAPTYLQNSSGIRIMVDNSQVVSRVSGSSSNATYSFNANAGTHTVRIYLGMYYSGDSVNIRVPANWSYLNGGTVDDPDFYSSVYYESGMEEGPDTPVFNNCISLNTNSKNGVPYDENKVGADMSNYETGYLTWNGPAISFFYNGQEYSGLVFNGTDISSLYFNGQQLF